MEGSAQDSVTLRPVIEAIKARLDSHKDARPLLVAIAGPPTAGKSTLADALTKHFETAGRRCKVLPMDGFHLDNRILTDKGLLARKGSAGSFDAEGFVALVRRIHTIQNDSPVFAPKFDRKKDLSIAGAIEISGQDLVLVEGNYLLYNPAPWQQLHPLWDVSLWLDITLEEVRCRCMKRWHRFGLNEKTARRRTEQNDMINARAVMDDSAPADFILTDY